MPNKAPWTVQKAFFFIFIIALFFFGECLGQNLSLKIEGHDLLETQTIDSLHYLKAHQDVSSINLELEQLQNKLYQLGYLENERKGLDKINDSTFLALVYLNNKFETLSLYYDKSIISPTILKQISNQVFPDYFNLKFSEIESSLHLISSELSTNGYPFAKLKLKEINLTDRTTMVARLTVEAAEKPRQIDKVIIKGYGKFPQTFLKYFLKIKPRQVFDIKSIKNKTDQISSLHFAKQIKTPEVLFSKDSTTLYLYLEKTQSNAFDGFLGFGTNDRTNKLEFDGFLNLNLVNNLNYGESLRLLYKSDENDQKTFEVATSLPYLFHSPIGMDALLRIFKRDSSFTTVNQSVKLHYQVHTKHKVWAGIQTTSSNNLLNDSFSVAIEDYDTNYVSMAYQFVAPAANQRLFPVKSKFFMDTYLGSRKTSLDTEKQSFITLDAFHIFNLNNKNSFYFRANGARLVSDTYFENELARFGGINSIRGFEENSLFASTYGLINTEYRLQLSPSLYLHSITDVAYYENPVTAIKSKLFGYGFGFGILTKSGLLKFNYANGKTEKTPFKLSNSKIHLSLSTRF